MTDPKVEVKGEKCYAPVFRGSNCIACLYLTIIFTAVIALLVISLVWLTAEGRCLIKQYQFRIRYCKQGNSDPQRLI